MADLVLVVLAVLDNVSVNEQTVLLTMSSSQPPPRTPQTAAIIDQKARGANRSTKVAGKLKVLPDQPEPHVVDKTPVLPPPPKVSEVGEGSGATGDSDDDEADDEEDTEDVEVRDYGHCVLCSSVHSVSLSAPRFTIR